MTTTIKIFSAWVDIFSHLLAGCLVCRLVDYSSSAGPELALNTDTILSQIVN